MTVKLWAALAALVSAALLAAIVYAGLTTSPLVRPTVGARIEGKAGGPPAAASAGQVLADRTRAQAEASVADGVTSSAIGSRGARITLDAPVKRPSETVGQWRSEVPASAKILQPSTYRSGISSLPYREADVLVQPQGREFRQARNEWVRYIGGIVIFLVCLALAVFLLWRGRIGAEEAESGRTVLRFDAFERAMHWMTATAFLVMALTGVVILYGKSLLLPLMGPSAFSGLAQASAWAHMAAAAPFVLGVLLMVARWLPGNLPTRADWNWLRKFGGFLHENSDNPPVDRFNAGQKLVFWGVVLGGSALAASGVMLMLPFFAAGYTGMQLTQLLHAGLGLAMIALIIGHIYIGSVGMVGAFQAMWSGLVDRNWAASHHKLWLDRLRDR
ncbi:MAG: formate dehydrogenase subunit gamma [Hyphomicrobiaceae bacterium]